MSFLLLSVSLLSVSVMLLSLSSVDAKHDNPNPPVWPGSVLVCDPSTPDVTAAAVAKAFALNGGHAPPLNGQFSSLRFAFLFKPGFHAVDVNVGLLF